MKLRQSLVRDRVRDLECSEPVAVRQDDTIHSVLERMKAQRVGCVVVLDAGGSGGGDAASALTRERLVGLFTERDAMVRVFAADKPVVRPVRDVMTPNPQTLAMDDNVADVIRRMHTGGFRHMPVVDDYGDVAGVISVKRVVQYLVEHFPEAVYNLPPDPDNYAATREGS